jgi:hypothetical protein
MVPTKATAMYELRPQEPWPPDFILNKIELFLGFMTSISIKPMNYIWGGLVRINKDIK